MSSHSKSDHSAPLSRTYATYCRSNMDRLGLRAKPKQKWVMPTTANPAIAEIIHETIRPSSKTTLDSLSDLSHEIRTPMSAIVGLAHLLLATKLDERQRKCLTLMQSSAEALMTMVDDVLGIGKMESGTMKPDDAPFDMKALLSQIIDTMSLKAQSKGIQLELRYSETSCSLFQGDSGHIRQIMFNLIGNAIKFTERGRVSVSFIGGDMENGKRHLSLAVADTGIGIPEDRIDAIFDRFIQANPSIAHTHGGTGLGLSISRTLAENMGGSIHVRSTRGQGSLFTLRLHLPELEDKSGREILSHENIVYLERDTHAHRD